MKSASMGMCLGTAVAMLCYAIGLFLISRRRA
jgi:hypothetical protein